MAANTKTRVRKLNVKQKKKAVRKTKTVPGAFRLLLAACRHIWANKKLFGGILLIYAVLYLVLVKGLATGFRLSETRQALEDTAGSETSSLGMAAAMLSVLIGTSGSPSGEAAGVYQAVLFVLISLVIIWALRQTFDGRRDTGLRAAFYKSAYPLVPYILVGLVILLQLLPALIGTTIYGIVSANGIAVGALEQILWFLVLIGSLAASVYLISSSLFASYIVTLPNMTPMSALRSARKLVRYRRFMVIRKVLFFPLIIGVIITVVFLPLVFYATVVAEAVFLVFVLLLLLLAHSYFYVLYRELL